MTRRGGVAAPLCLVRWALVAAMVLGMRTAIAGGAEPTATNGDVQDLIVLAAKGPSIIRLHLRVDGQPYVQLRSGIAKQLFEALDADGNGVLEGPELARIPSPELLSIVKRAREDAARHSALPAHAPQGRVTPEALAEYLSPYRIAGFALDFDQGQKPSARYAARALPDGYQPAMTVDMNSLLAVLDANGDGRVTVAECLRVDELFHSLDLNDDETISRAELAEVASAKTSARKGTASPLSEAATLLQPVDHWGTQLELARALSEKYRRMSTAEAMRWLLETPPRFELDVALPKKSLLTPSVAIRNGAAPSAGDGDGIHAGTGGQVVLQLGGLPIELRAAEAPPRPVSAAAYAKGIFKRADRDNNGYLEASELAQTNLGIGPDEFKAIDADHNGMIFEDEWLAFMTVDEIISENRVTLTVAVTATDPIAEFDSNGDGRLTHGEWKRALATIRTWDANNDGEISPEEVPRHFVGTFHLGRERPSASRGEMNGMGKSAPPSDAALGSTPAWFQKMDRNRDGEVSFREFLGPLSVFRRLDLNHDGVLDADEAKKSAEP